MKRLLQFLMTVILSVALVGCYSTEEPIGPEVPVVGSLKLSQEEMTVSAEGGEFSVDIFTEYAYKTSTNVDWITMSGGSCGTEYCTLYFTVAKNDTSSVREGVITVFCDDYNLSATLTITQEAGENAGDTIPNNEIWYTSFYGKAITPNATDVFGVNIVSNTYKDGKGVIIFDGKVTQVGKEAYSGRELLTSIILPNSVTSIGENAFKECTKLTSVTIPNSVTSIKWQAFANCYLLTSMIIPNGVTSIEWQTFVNCWSLKDVTIPDSVTEIGDGAFGSCSSLISITIPDSVTSIGYSAFYWCKSLETFYGKYASEDNRCLIIDGVLHSFAIGCGATEYTIPDSVTSIGEHAFADCASLTSIILHERLAKIERWAFLDCFALKEVYCKPATPPVGGEAMFAYRAPDYNPPIGCKIYVPAASVEAYKASKYWSDYADDIVGYDF